MKANYFVKAFELWMLENNMTYKELSEIGDANINLNIIIEDLISSLDKYEQKPNKNEFYVNKQKILIKRLIEISQIQKFYLFHNHLVKINELILSLQEKDPDLSGINIQIVFNNRNSVFAQAIIYFSHG